MRTSTLSWFIAAALALAALAASAMSYVPDARIFGNVLSTSLGIAAMVAIAAATWVGCLPPDHHIRQSRSINSICLVLAILAALLAVMLG